MDWLTFSSKIIDSLAWPLVIIVALFLLRKPISDLIPFLRKLKWRDFEAEFGREVDKMRSVVNRELPAPVPPPKEGPEIGLLTEKTLRLAELSPRSVVLEAWREVEHAAEECAKRGELPIMWPGRKVSPVVVGRALAEAGVLDENQLEIFHSLRSLRNKAAHAEEFAFAKDDALEYADMASRLSDFLTNY